MSSTKKIVLIVATAFIVLMIILIGSCVIFRDDIVRIATVVGISKFKQNVLSDSTLAVDSVAFDRLTTSFSEKLQKEEHLLSDERYTAFMQKMQVIFLDKHIDSADVNTAVNAMTSYFPGLQSEWPATEMPDTALSSDLTTVTDTIMTE